MTRILSFWVAQRFSAAIKGFMDYYALQRLRPLKITGPGFHTVLIPSIAANLAIRDTPQPLTI
jgi:hypothetical protein